MAERRTIKQKPWTELLPPKLIIDRQTMLAIYYNGSMRDARILARSVIEQNMKLFVSDASLYPKLAEIVEGASYLSNLNEPSVNWVAWFESILDDEETEREPKHLRGQVPFVRPYINHSYQPRHLQT